MKRTVNSSYGPVELEVVQGLPEPILATFKPASFLPAVTLAFSLEEAAKLSSALVLILDCLGCETLDAKP